MRIVLSVLVAAGAVGALTFVLLYAVGSRGWHKTAVGQNLMALAAVLGGLLTLWLVGRAVHLPLWIWVVGMGLLDAVLWWRVVILWRLQHEEG